MNNENEIKGRLVNKYKYYAWNTDLQKWEVTSAVYYGTWEEACEQCAVFKRDSVDKWSKFKPVYFGQYVEYK